MIKINVENAIAEIDSATPDDIEFGPSEILTAMYDYYVTYLYVGGNGVPVSPQHFRDYWDDMPKGSKASFVRTVFSN